METYNFTVVIEKDEDMDYDFKILALNILINTLENNKQKKNFSSVLSKGEERILAASITWGTNEADKNT